MPTLVSSLLNHCARLAALGLLALPAQAGDHVLLGNHSRQPWTLRIEAGTVGRLAVKELKSNTTTVLERKGDYAIFHKDTSYDLDFQTPQNGTQGVAFSLVDQDEADKGVIWVVAGGKFYVKTNPCGVSPLNNFENYIYIINQDTWADVSLHDRMVQSVRSMADQRETKTEAKAETKR